ncbi:IS66 family transposase [Mesorhizobium caraganae]|uniref:IS66 family transposase n=1 Tax=Mesorhizobium caraganae TaxID=483206 RepID=UPI003F4F484B
MAPEVNKLADTRCLGGRAWIYVRDGRPFQGPAPSATAFFYSPDRKAERPREHLKVLTGFLQADAYAGFEELYDLQRTNPSHITEVASRSWVQFSGSIALVSRKAVDSCRLPKLRAT